MQSHLMEAPPGTKSPLSRQELVAEVEDATEREHQLTIPQAIRLYPKAVAWSIVISCTAIMDGYDYHIMSSLFAQPAFQRTYGVMQPDGSYQVSAAWQSGLNNGSTVGSLMGLYFSGYLTDRLGYRKTIMTALVAVTGLIFLQFFATNLVMLQVGQILLGLPLGVFQTVTHVYAIDVAPLCLRPILTSYVGAMWFLGQTIVSGVFRGVLDMEAPWAYRVPFAIQWFWVLPVFVAVVFAPESPWWLIRNGQMDEAKRSLKRLASGAHATQSSIEKTAALMHLTTEYERRVNAGVSYVSCFRGTDRRRTVIVIFLFTMQIIGGTTLRSYATYFFEEAGLSASLAFDMSIVTFVLSFLGTFLAWFIMPYVGRRTLFLWGVYVNTAIFFIIGGLGMQPNNNSFVWTIAALLVVNAFFSCVCMEPVVFALVPDIPSTVLRSKTVPIGRFVYSVINIPLSILTSYMINSSAWGWGAKDGFFWAGLGVLGVLATHCILRDKGQNGRRVGSPV